MIVGVEGVHAWTSYRGVEAVLNNRALWPHLRVRRIDGLRGTSDFDPQADPATQRLGETPREGERDGKTIVYHGDVRCRSLAELRQVEASTVAAFMDTGVGEVLASAHDDYSGGDLPPRKFTARCIDCTIEDEQRVGPNRRSLGYERPFTVALRLPDPRYYHLTQISEDSATLATVGGTSLPITPGDAVEPPSTAGITLTTDNLGNADVDAVLLIEGPMVNPIVSNETTGHFLRFRDLTLEAGERLEIDFHARTVRRPGVDVNVRHKLDPKSTWWDRGVSCLVPGANTVRVRAYSISAPASLSLDYYPADYS